MLGMKSGFNLYKLDLLKESRCCRDIVENGSELLNMVENCDCFAKEKGSMTLVSAEYDSSVISPV